MKLLENNNRKFIRTLSNNCLKANRGRNNIAVIAVILTAVMFMALTTVLEGTQISMKNQMLRQVGSKFMVSLKNLTQEEAERLVMAPEFAIAGIEQSVASAVNSTLNNVSVSIGWMDTVVTENSFMHLEAGHAPENINEIACDTEVLRLLGLPEDAIGRSFVLQYTAGTKPMEKEMIVCGIWKGRKYEQSASMLVSKPFVEEVLSNCDGEYEWLRTTSYCVRGSFASEKNIAEQLDRMVEKIGYNPSAERGEDGFLIHHVNPVYESASMGDTMAVYVAEGIGVLLILFAGYLIIYNIFKISVKKDIRLYGQLKTIGTSPRQIRYMVIRQGTVLSLTGIPAGLVLGWLLGNALLPIVMTNFTMSEAEFIIPPVWVWALSGLFTWITVRISCGRPGRIAGRISPVEALKYHGAQNIARTHQHGMDSSHRIASMAAKNLGRNKGKTVLVVLSISFSAVLLNSILNFAGSMDQELYVRRGSITDFDVRSADYNKPMLENHGKVVPQQAVQTLREMEGIRDFGLSYCYMLPDAENVSKQEDLAKIKRVNGQETMQFDMGLDENCMIYGFDASALSLAQVIEGSVDYEKLCTGDYVVMVGYLDDRSEFHDELQYYHAGDVIAAEIGGAIQEYTVLAVLGMPSSMMMSYSSGGYECIGFAEPVFWEKFPMMQQPIHCLFNAAEGDFDEVNAQVGAIAQYSGLTVQTRLTAEAEFKETQYTYSMVGIVSALILGGIGVLNLINMILTGVIARQKEFASMRSIGMTKKQLRKMIVYEGMYYAVLAGVVGIAASGVLSLTLVRVLAETMWFMKYDFTVLPAVLTSIICLLLAVYICAMTDKVWNKGSIVEQLREIE